MTIVECRAVVLCVACSVTCVGKTCCIFRIRFSLADCHGTLDCAEIACVVCKAFDSPTFGRSVRTQSFRNCDFPCELNARRAF